MKKFKLPRTFKNIFTRDGHSKKGVTLIELLIYMGIFAILIIVLMDLFVSVVQVKQRTAIKTGLDVDSRYILNRLQYDINRATSISTPNTVGTTSASLVLVISGQNYTYTISSGNLQLVDPTGTYNLNSTETTATSITFKKIGNSAAKATLKTDLTLQSTTQKSSGAVSKTFSGVFGQR